MTKTDKEKQRPTKVKKANKIEVAADIEDHQVHIEVGVKVRKNPVPKVHTTPGQIAPVTTKRPHLSRIFAI